MTAEEGKTVSNAQETIVQSEFQAVQNSADNFMGDGIYQLKVKIPRLSGKLRRHARLTDIYQLKRSL